MADKDTLNLIKFKFGSFQSIKDLSSKDQSSFYFASDKPTFYNAGVWYGVSSLTSNLNEDTGEVTIKLNSNLGENNWQSSQMECKFMGITPTQANKINVAYDFVTGNVEDADNVINQWKEVVDFLKGIEEQEGGLAVKFQNLDKRIDNEATARQEADTQHSNDIKAINDMLAEMFTLERDGKTLKSIKANVGLWSESFISARGVDNESSGVGGLDAQAVWDLLMQNDDATKIINVAHIPDITVAKITDFTAKVNSLVANKTDKDDTITYVPDATQDENPANSYGVMQGVGAYINVGSKSNNYAMTFACAGDNIRVKTTHGGILRDWRDIAWAGTTLAGYGITDAYRKEEVDSVFVKKGVSVSGKDLNNFKETGFFYGYGVENAESSNINTFILNRYSSDWGSQIQHDLMTNHIYFRTWRNAGGVFDSEWKAVLDSSNYSNYTVDLTSAQTISGVKTFGNGIHLNNTGALTGDCMYTGYSFKLGGYGNMLTFDTKATSSWSEEIKFSNSSNADNVASAKMGAFGAASNIHYLYFGLNGQTNNDATFKVYPTTATINNNIIWHAGNMGEDSGLNADKLDGLHASDFWTSKGGSIESETDIDVFTARASGAYTVRHEGSSSTLFVFRDENYSWSSLSSLELYAPHYDISEGLKVRTSISNNRYSAWREVAFTDTNKLIPRSGTLNINGKLTVSNQITIGNATLYWDVANQCLRVNAGIASDSFLSAKGVDTTGNGQGGGGGLDATMLWNELTIPSPTNTGKTIMLDLLPDIPTSKVTDFANQVKALITVENIPILTSAKISDFNTAVATAMSSTLSDISSNLSNHEQRLQAIEKALTWQGVS